MKFLFLFKISRKLKMTSVTKNLNIKKRKHSNSEIEETSPSTSKQANITDIDTNFFSKTLDVNELSSIKISINELDNIINK